MDIVLLLAIASLSNIACFVIGAAVGQKVVKAEPIATPTVNPVEAYKEHKQKKEAEAEKNKIDTILRNIDIYDGTGYGQEEVR
jgi:hypothetical protein